LAINKNGGYINIQEYYRLQFLVLQKKLESEYGQISKELLERIKVVINRYTDANGIIRKTDLEAVTSDLNEVSIWFHTKYGQWIDSNIAKSIDTAVLGQDTASMYFIKAMVAEYGNQFGTLRDLQAKTLIQQQYGSGLSRSIRQQVWNHRWEDGYNLSDRIWTMDKTLRTNLNGMIEQCVNQGISAVEFSRAVEQYLEVPGPSWTTKIKPAVTDRGSLKYNALRLARTETNQGYHQAQGMAAQNSVIVRGQKWNLSRSHPKKDICDLWATQNIHGLGPGVYRPGETPRDHPNGLCFLTDVLYEGEQLIARLKEKYKIA
jgi:hypothetical protein